MMKRGIFLLTLFVITNVSLSYAQEYDSDSAYYTPIPKLSSKKNQKKEAEPASKKVEYFFNVQAGTLMDINDCNKGKVFTFSAATVHGITIGRKFRTGLGVGFDSYQNWQTMPVFGMASWDLIGNKNKNALFVQLSYGLAHPWFVRDGAYSNYASDPFSGVSGGRMINPQIGYRLKYYNLKLSMAIGYKFQQIFYKRPNYYYINCPACDIYTTTLTSLDITQDMNRVQIIMSVGWK